MEELLCERYRLVGHLQGRPERIIGMGLQRLLALLENALQPGPVVSRVARGPVVVRSGAVALGSGGFAHAVLLRGLSLLGVSRPSPRPPRRWCPRRPPTALPAAPGHYPSGGPAPAPRVIAPRRPAPAPCPAAFRVGPGAGLPAT